MTEDEFKKHSYLIISGAESLGSKRIQLNKIWEKKVTSSGAKVSFTVRKYSLDKKLSRYNNQVYMRLEKVSQFSQFQMSPSHSKCPFWFSLLPMLGKVSNERYTV